MTNKRDQIIRDASVGAAIVRKDPAPRHVTPDVVTHLREGGASKDLVDFARRHVESPRAEPQR
jgi:hypothetical protein